MFQLKFENSHYAKIQGSTSTFQESERTRELCSKPIKASVFFELFPFHIIFQRSMNISSLGESLKQGIKHAEGESIRDVFNLNRPLISFTWDDVI